MQRRERRYLSVGWGGLLLLVALPLQAAGPFRFFTLNPCRLVDTRSAVGPNGGPILLDGVPRCFQAQGTCGIAMGAGAVFVNITAVGPTGSGHLRVYPCGIIVPLVSSLNFSAGDQARGNGAIVPLCPDQPLDFCVFPRVAGGGTTHLVVDVLGYFQ